MILKSDGKCIASDVEFAKSMFSQKKRLMFRKKISGEYALIFMTIRFVTIRVLFVRFPIDMLFLDESELTPYK
ncbi:MAG: DUF192 domain-containing protein [Methanosarcinaceae archaeon]|nr:DUF192 domain-containing protein [Methanosarcinaceae archaeon]